MSHLARNCTGSASVSCRRPQIAIEGIIDPQVQALIIVSAPGLYGLVMTNRKDAARRFQRWVKHEVLPSIQRTGGYMMNIPGETERQFWARARPPRHHAHLRLPERGGTRKTPPDPTLMSHQINDLG